MTRINIQKERDNILTKDSDNLEKKIILLVEDDQISAYLIQEYLKAYHSQKQNLDYIHIKQGKDAIDYCKRKKADLVLMDIKLEDSNGIDITRNIKNINPDLTIIAQTAYTSDDVRKEAIDAGCSDYLTKPVSLEKFETILEKYL